MNQIFFLILILVVTNLFAQRTDFYDPYDYDLRNQKVKTLEEEKFKIYNLPPKRQVRPSLNPKKVQKDLDFSSIVPQNTPFRVAPQNQNLNNSPVNLYTGEINVEQILKNEEEKQRQKESKLKNLQNFEKLIYSESKWRRGEIIFLMTFPFSLGFTAILVSAINYSQPGFIRTPQATILLSVGSIGLSLGNVYLDFLRYNDYMKEKQKNPNMDKALEFYFSVGKFHF